MALLFVALATGFVALVDYSSECYFYFPLARTRRQGLDGEQGSLLEW